MADSSEAPAPPGRRPSLLDPGTLRQLLLELEHTDVDELEIVAGSSRLYLRREPGRRAPMPGESAGQAALPGVPIVAPLSGVYYSRPTPDEAPYATAGSVIEAGQVVALIETMKIFNEIRAEIGGEVIEVTVREGDLVEAGATLMYIRPLERDGA